MARVLDARDRRGRHAAGRRDHAGRARPVARRRAHRAQRREGHGAAAAARSEPRPERSRRASLQSLPSCARRRTSCACARSCASGRSRSASAWSTRPRSSPRRASSRATRSIHGGGGEVALHRARANGTRKGLRLVFADAGPGHRRHRAGAEGRLHHRRRAGPRPGRREAACRTSSRSSRSPARARASPSRAGSDEPPCADSRDRRAERRRRGAARSRRARARRCGFDEDARGPARARGDRGRDQHRQARAAAARSCCARSSSAAARQGVEVLALDRGPGIANLAASLRDGYSTAGSPGTGLGAIAAHGGEFDVYSQPGHGHAACASRPGRSPPATAKRCACRRGQPAEARRAGLRRRLGASSQRTRPRRAVRGRRARPRPGGRRRRRAARVEAVDAASRLRRRPSLMEAVHDALRPTRGAAVAVADAASRQASCARSAASATSSASIRGAGACAQHGLAQRHRRARRAQDPGVQLSVPARRAAASCTPTASARTGTSPTIPGSRRAHPALIAGVLYRDHSRGRDDVTVVVVRNGAGAAA